MQCLYLSALSGGCSKVHCVHQRMCLERLQPAVMDCSLHQKTSRSRADQRATFHRVDDMTVAVRSVCAWELTAVHRVLCRRETLLRALLSSSQGQRFQINFRQFRETTALGVKLETQASVCCKVCKHQAVTGQAVSQPKAQSLIPICSRFGSLEK